MNLHERIETLRHRHDELQSAINTLSKNYTSEIEVHDLKKKKLAIKDEIAQLTAQL
ncbi:MAG: hypothetical protein CBB68_10000 [Rhodospirillaceae bacterium TMED8]|nr:hypothetical protein [Magnetovibrio sp.]OUT50187.1 MAG: hypothetical protein CBB68_10000 [Rhodospirillaceae bacterium TMED8]|tara:strand:+ start:529 stop:696 length:168 start_codon:yes stop_codon:yes gene_type:complete